MTPKNLIVLQKKQNVPSMQQFLLLFELHLGFW
jgi:hypothetical protein